MTYAREFAVPRVCLDRRLGFVMTVPRNACRSGVLAPVNFPFYSRISAWMPVPRNWHCLAWPHSSITEEDQLALNAGWLKSCPLLDKSGQKWILAGDGLSAFDPTATLAVPKGSTLGAGWLGVAK